MQVFEFGDRSAGRVLVQPVDAHDLDAAGRVLEGLQERVSEPVCLALFPVQSWNRDLSPWEADAVFGREGFGGKAEDTLAEILDYCRDTSREYYIGGYSLAGLFALWAASRTDIFRGVAAVSPSVWFPGYTDFLRENPIRSPRVYLSLGDREEKTRNPVMATVGDRIRDTYEILRDRKVDCVLEWNEGNHFRDYEERMIKGYEWLLRG